MQQEPLKKDHGATSRPRWPSRAFTARAQRLASRCILSRLRLQPQMLSTDLPRTIQALHYLVAIRDPAHTSPLAPLRPFTTLLLPLLGDSDPTVRSLALSSTITIFSADGVTQPARADLKKAMIKLDVNKKVQDTVLAAVLGGGSGSMERTGSAASLASGSEKAVAGSSVQEIHLSTSTDSTSPPITRSRPRPPSPASLVASLPSAAFPSDPSAVHAPTTDIQPVYIADLRDLQTEFDRMREGFEGKETEHNWMVRDRSIARIRGMVKGNVQERLLEPFLAGIKGVQDGITKTVSSCRIGRTEAGLLIVCSVRQASSLRTTVAISALSLISELSSALRHAFDPFLEYFLSHALSMAGQTKKIVATASQATVTALITNSAYHHKTLQLLRQGMDEKTTSARGFVSSHVGTFVKVHGRASKSAIEATGGVEEIEQSVKKGLTDPNPLVKENSRTTFWAVREIWPKMAERIAGSLDTSSKKQLDKLDPSKKGAVEKAPAAKTTRPSVRELMMQAKRQAATGAVPEPSTDLLPETVPLAPAAAQSPPPSSRPSSLYGKIPTPRSAVSPSTRSISSPSTPTARPRPGLASSTPGSSARRISQTPTLTTPTTSIRQASPTIAAPLTPSSPALAPTPSDGGHIPALSSPKAGDESLINFSSPFGAVDRDGSSLTFSGSAPSSPSSSSQAPRGRIDSLVLPVTESIVDDALRDQAMQAEQAAERLLELAEEEEEEVEGNATRHGGIEGQMRTPVSKKMQLLREGDVFEDSPDARNGEGAGGVKGKRNWWMKKAESELAPPLTPFFLSLVPVLTTSLFADVVVAAPLPPDTLERSQEIASLISSLQSNLIDIAGLKKLSALSKERPVRDEDGGLSSPLASPTYSKNGDGQVLPFWEEDRRFSRIWEALSAMLGKEQVSRPPNFAADGNIRALTFLSLFRIRARRIPLYCCSRTWCRTRLLALPATRQAYFRSSWSFARIRHGQ